MIMDKNIDIGSRVQDLKDALTAHEVAYPSSKLASYKSPLDESANELLNSAIDNLTGRNELGNHPSGEQIVQLMVRIRKDQKERACIFGSPPPPEQIITYLLGRVAAHVHGFRTIDEQGD